MEQFTIEISAYRVGGSDNMERVFSPRFETVAGNASYAQLQGRNRASAMLYIEMTGWTIVRPGLYSAFMFLKDETGMPVNSGRPVAFSPWPCDVPLYSTHVANNPDFGLFTVGLRPASRSWMPDHAALLQAPEPDAPGGVHR